MARSLLLVAILLLALPPAASGDVIHLKNGRTITGESERTPEGLRVRQDLGTVLIPHRDIVRVEIRETPRQTYSRRLKALRADDVAGHLGLAEFCVAQGLDEQARQIALPLVAKQAGQVRLHKVLSSLDFHRVGGVWQPPEVYYPAQGYERIDGRWLPPERARVVKASRALRELQKEARVAVKALAFQEGNVEAAERRLERAERGLEQELADQLRLEGRIEAARVELRRREQDLDHAQARALQARGGYNRWIRIPCHCNDGCACGWERRRLALQRSCATSEQATKVARVARDRASCHLQSLIERKADGPNRLVRLEGAIGDAEAALPKVHQRMADTKAAHGRALATLERAEVELRKAKIARDKVQ